jgi:hypothetical protein
MLELYFKYEGVLRRLRSGALGGEMDRIAAHYSETGYKPASAKVYISRLARFSDFVDRNGRTAKIDQNIIDRFVQSLPTASPRVAARTAIEHARHARSATRSATGSRSRVARLPPGGPSPVPSGHQRRRIGVSKRFSRLERAKLRFKLPLPFHHDHLVQTTLSQIDYAITVSLACLHLFGDLVIRLPFLLEASEHNECLGRQVADRRDGAMGYGLP